VAQSAFTVSDLFITHYALLLPLIPLAGGLAFGTVWEWAYAGVWGRRSVGVCGHGRIGRAAGQTRAVDAPPHAHTTIPHRTLAALAPALAFIALLAWAGGDLWTTIRYHRSLAASGGHAAHSDASARLAAYLDRGSLSAPVTLDWGLDAPVRFLTAGRVSPVEVFGYAGLDAPDAGFGERLASFIGNPANVYLAHAPDQTVFRGRVEALAELAAGQGLILREEARFNERSGTPLFVVYRLASRDR
jgi:hypothetical protein